MATESFEDRLEELLNGGPMGPRGEVAGVANLIARGYVIARRQDPWQTEHLAGVEYALRLALMGWATRQHEINIMFVELIDHWEERETWRP